ncbi:MAG: YlbF family regulator [Clostridia bacterium]|nr:YlbF family regulator [Clostridia bacterium]MBQ4085489.1 YlbF family regulator [Clostridia bacterium]
MNPVFAKTRELAEAIMQSEEFMTMKTAEERAMKNAEAAAAMAEYLEKRHEIETLLESKHPAPERLRELSEEIDLAQQKMKMVPDVVAMSEARENFAELINQVNKVLRFMITGDTGETDEPSEEGGCTGSCSTCSGCSHLS